MTFNIYVIKSRSILRLVTGTTNFWQRAEIALVKSENLVQYLQSIMQPRYAISDQRQIQIK